MHYITVTYPLITEVISSPQYKFTRCGLLFNTQTGRQVKRISKDGQIGYYIAGKFRRAKDIAVRPIEQQDCPF